MHKDSYNLLVYPESPGGVKRDPDTLAVGECCDGGGAEVTGGECEMVVGGGRLETVGDAGVRGRHGQRGGHGGGRHTHLWNKYFYTVGCKYFWMM